jgi:hypothetical protein
VVTATAKLFFFLPCARSGHICTSMLARRAAGGATRLLPRRHVYTWQEVVNPQAGVAVLQVPVDNNISSSHVGAARGPQEIIKVSQERERKKKKKERERKKGRERKKKGTKENGTNVNKHWRQRGKKSRKKRERERERKIEREEGKERMDNSAGDEGGSSGFISLHTSSLPSNSLKEKKGSKNGESKPGGHVGSKKENSWEHFSSRHPLV